MTIDRYFCHVGPPDSPDDCVKPGTTTLTVGPKRELVLLCDYHAVQAIELLESKGLHYESKMIPTIGRGDHRRETLEVIRGL